GPPCQVPSPDSLEDSEEAPVADLMFIGTRGSRQTALRRSWRLRSDRGSRVLESSEQSPGPSLSTGISEVPVSPTSKSAAKKNPAPLSCSKGLVHAFYKAILCIEVMIANCLFRLFRLVFSYSFEYFFVFCFCSEI